MHTTTEIAALPKGEVQIGSQVLPTSEKESVLGYLRDSTHSNFCPQGIILAKTSVRAPSRQLRLRVSNPIKITSATDARGEPNQEGSQLPPPGAHARA